jgi:ABC-type transport system involved in cytochrome bd biosynthesis fused ATPase/permease subunit
MLRFGLVAFLFGVPLVSGQQPPAPPSGAGMSDAQVVAIFNGISQHMARLEPMLAQVRVKEWGAKGAPDAYVQQLASIRREIQGIESDMARLAQRSDQMQDCMRALFRVQALHVPLHSLMGGLRKYQNPALADLIESVAAEDQTQITRFEQYVLELADSKDQLFNIADKEAQRCRATLSRQPAPRAKTTHNQ